MARGGARNRGPTQPDPQSLRSASRDFTAVALPAEGHDGPVPDFPLPGATSRELEVWRDAWALPQASAWAAESWRWRTVAMWSRWSVRMEDPSSPAALAAVVVRLADQIGLTPAGLRENGWQVSRDKALATPAAQPPAGPDYRARFDRPSARDRMQVVPDYRERFESPGATP